MKRRALLAAGVLLPAAARAQPARRRPRVGVLIAGTAAVTADRIAALREGLAEHGYVEPGTLELILRYADGHDDLLPALARELVAEAPNVIVAGGTRSVRVVMDATKTIPIVIASATDAVGAGLVASLARPGGNVTGLTLQRFDTAPKEVELLAELVPGLARLAVLRGPAGGAGRQLFEAIRAAAATRGIDARSYEVESADEVDAAFRAMSAAGSQAVILVDGPLLSVHRDRIDGAGLAARLPVFASSREYVDAGALASYGASAKALYRRAGYFVDRILKGASPADLPVEQPTVFELVINLKTARALGLAIPQTVLLRADEVIE